MVAATLEKLRIFSYIYYLFIGCGQGHTGYKHMWGSEDNLKVLVVSCHKMGPGGEGVKLRLSG